MCISGPATGTYLWLTGCFEEEVTYTDPPASAGLSSRAVCNSRAMYHRDTPPDTPRRRGRLRGQQDPLTASGPTDQANAVSHFPMHGATRNMLGSSSPTPPTAR